MNPDISELLDKWPYESGRINARLVKGKDGQPRIQVRLDLGLLQMHTDGRPDGQRPFGYTSLLEYYESKMDDARGNSTPDDRGPEIRGSRGGAEPGGDDDEEVVGPRDEAGGIEEPPEASDGAGEGPSGGGAADARGEEPEAPEGVPEEFSLSPEDCRALREEAVQYYHRYLAEMALEDFEAVVRDTTRNLRVLDLCRDHATADEDKHALEQFRPYITMMRARALASQSLKDNEPKAAIFAIEEALELLKKHFQEHDQLQLFESSNEVQMLKSMRDALVPKLPVSQKGELKARLQRALEQENYELAAILRDELKMLKE
jgi:hypothetical protein